MTYSNCLLAACWEWVKSLVKPYRRAEKDLTGWDVKCTIQGHRTTEKGR